MVYNRDKPNQEVVATLSVHAEKAPIKTNADGVALVGGTRVPLETVIAAYQRGESPEQIVDDFDVLALGDVYAVIAYYLNHREEVGDYIRQQDLAAEEVRCKIEANQPQMLSIQRVLLERKQECTSCGSDHKTNRGN